VSFWKRALRHKSFVAGGVLVLALIALALLSFVWTPHSATEIDVPNKLLPPSATHWLGTDSLGRDIVSLLIVGARASIAVGRIAVGISITIGVALGLLARHGAAQVERR
jgi:peptide/nickel transport system permease protein